jgi:uncharacterized protein (DUF1800 family)
MPILSCMSTASSEALVAHVLRRCSIAPDPERVARFVRNAPDPRAAANAAIDWALSAAPRPIQPAQQRRDDWEGALNGWTDNLRSRDAGLHERMTWFWHGLFATGSDKVGNLVMLNAQQRLFRTHALGNYGALLRQMVTDPALMVYLDMAWSSVEAPNENMARELMELFTIGPGNYTEDDVKSGALALAGYELDYDNVVVTKNPKRSLGGEVVFLGQRGRFGVDEIVQILLAHPATAPHIAGKLHHHLVGVTPSAERAAALGGVFRAAGYEIKPLVEAIVRSEEFLTSRLNRPKFPIEWWAGALHALTPFRSSEDQRVNPWVLSSLGQLPHRPPNVAGWPISTKWFSSDQQISRASYVRSLSWRMTPIVAAPDLVTATLARCCLHEVSDRTRAILNEAALATAGNADELTISRRLIAAALLSPEFAIA